MKKPLSADEGRDELNLAEFPVACLASRAPRGQKTLVFEDSVWDRGSRKRVPRRLTISCSDKYGLPTALDDEVLVGLIQLTFRSEQPARSVAFSRYQLIDLLGWRKEGKSYRRMETSLRKWVGVTLYYEKAWWNKSERRWMDEHFHVLDQVTLPSARHGVAGKDKHGVSVASSFVWSQVVFQSFQTGYLKRLDLGVYRRLEHSAAKRMYRFLDKRFYHQDRWVFDLREFACEHVGLSRKHDIAQLKRKLQPAIRELEEAGILSPTVDRKRFAKVCRGRWEVVFEKARVEHVDPTLSSMKNGLVSELVDRGMSTTVARRMAREYSPEHIREKMALLDWLLRQDPTGIASPGGFLVESIRKDYSLPPEARAWSRNSNHRSAARQVVTGRKAVLTRTGREDPFAERLARARKYLDSISAEEQEQLGEVAVANGPRFLRDLYHRRLRDGSPLAEMYRNQLVVEHVLGLLGEAD